MWKLLCENINNKLQYLFVCFFLILLRYNIWGGLSAKCHLAYKHIKKLQQQKKNGWNATLQKQHRLWIYTESETRDKSPLGGTERHYVKQTSSSIKASLSECDAEYVRLTRRCKASETKQGKNKTFPLPQKQILHLGYMYALPTPRSTP